VRKHNQKYAAMHTPAHKARLAEGLNARWERYREETADRDAALVERYRDSSISIKAVAAEFGIAYQTARNALLRAEMRGEVTIRPQGSNARWQNARM
jgi:predicted Rossmann fold nucleotide-binding protein DprA/Smf involved in DNA uptake